MSKSSKNKLVMPFLKWVGGKRQLIPDITELISKNNDGIARLIASLVKVEYQNRDILASISNDIKAQGEKLDKIASGIQTMNDKYNKTSAYIRK